MTRVSNKIALITGGARGIGAATAKLLTSEGAFVIITDIRDELGKEVAAQIGDQAVYYHLDVAQESDWQTVVKTIEERHQKIDILFNNAGIGGFDNEFGPQDPENTSLEIWHKMHSINLDGVFLGCKYGIKLMKEHGGSIINMSSRAGLVGVPVAVAYASTKAAVRNHTKSVALYCADQGYPIRCNSVHPGAILTPMWDPFLGNDSLRQSRMDLISQGVPLGHMGEPLDVAYAVLFLASDESKYITGIEFNIDGGILAGHNARVTPQDLEDIK